MNWLPDYLITHLEHKPCHLLYYTGIPVVVKSILAEIVRKMFLNSADHLQLLDEMNTHALDMAEYIQRGNFTQYRQMISKTWKRDHNLQSEERPLYSPVTGKFPDNDTLNITHQNIAWSSSGISILTLRCISMVPLHL